MQEIYICTLSPETECLYRKEDVMCSNENEGCGFRKKKESSKMNTRQEKWFEKYYKKK